MSSATELRYSAPGILIAFNCDGELSPADLGVALGNLDLIRLCLESLRKPSGDESGDFAPILADEVHRDV